MIDNRKILKNFGSKVKKLRVAKELTQEQLAEHMDLQPETITSIEIGRTFISCNVLTKLCNFFNVEPSYFFSFNQVDLIEKDLDYIKEINRQLLSINSNKLAEIYKIIIALKN